MTTPYETFAEPTLEPATSVPDARSNLGQYPTYAVRALRHLRGDPCGFQMVNNPAVAVGLQVPDAALSAVVQVQDQPVRYQTTGNAPTAAVGHRGAPGDTVVLEGKPAMKLFQVINEGGLAANLAVSFFS